MTKLILHGELGKQFGREYDLSIASPLDGIRALASLKPGFKEYFAQGDYCIYTQVGKKREYLDDETVKISTGYPVHVVPAVKGGKNKGVGKILAGIALIGVSFIPGLNVAVFGALGGMSATAMGATALGTAMTTVAATVSGVAAQAALVGGLTLALGGAASLTAPKVAQSTESTLFSGNPDSITENTPVPLVYGEYLAIGYPVSFELVTGMNAYSGTNGYYSGGGGASGGSGGAGGGGSGGWWTDTLTTTNIV